MLLLPITCENVLFFVQRICSWPTYDVEGEVGVAADMASGVLGAAVVQAIVFGVGTG